MPTNPRVLIAPNAFKGSLDAVQAAEAIASGLRASRLQATFETFPIGDGGDGTGRALLRAMRGRSAAFTIDDPLGRPITAGVGLVDDGGTAVIEMADASGLRLLELHERDPWHASSLGTGQLIRHALDLGVRKILLGVGGSATVDGGMGILHALGARFMNAEGAVLPPCPASLSDTVAIDLHGLDQRLSGCPIVILCDVRNPLLGVRGAAAVFGPQKGALPENVVELDVALSRLMDLLCEAGAADVRHAMYGGAAGGVAAGLMSVLRAEAVEGIEFFLNHTAFDAALNGASLVITGEGSIDAQTLEGKAPFGVAERARRRQVPVVVFAGMVPLRPDAGLDEVFDVLSAIGEGPVPLREAMRNAALNLHRKGMELGNTLHIGGRLRALVDAF